MPAQSVALPGGDDPPGDLRDLGRGFAGAEDHFRVPLTNTAVMVDTGETKILKRQGRA